MQNSNTLIGSGILLLLYYFGSCRPAINDSGTQLYTQYCANCHMDDGSGLQRLIPPLAQSDYLAKHRQELPCIIQHGMTGSVVVNGQEYNQAMPGAERLTADRITNLLNYIQTNMGNNNERFTIPEVTTLLESCVNHQH